MKYRLLSAPLSLPGLFVALYLYLYKIGRIGTLACGTGGCETVQLSPYSRFLGVEVALYGVAGYLVLLVLSLAAVQSPPVDRRWPSLLFLLSGIGLLFTAYLPYLELFVIHAICRWCVGSAAVILSIFVVAWLDRRQQTPASESAPIR